MEKLTIYQKSLLLVERVYRLVHENPSLRRDLSLSDQLKRASISICANIAEGFARSRKQFKNYLRISVGSTSETVALLEIVQRVHGIETGAFIEEYKYLGKQINAFSNRLVNQN